MAKLSQRRTSKKQKVLQRSNPFVSETFVSFGLLAGAPDLETDFNKTRAKARGFAPGFCLSATCLVSARLRCVPTKQESSYFYTALN
jgi:hypothetical protein